MCYAIPGRVVAIADRKVTVDYFGEQRTAINELDHLTPGDYIYAQGGYVIETIPALMARDILDLWEELFFQLQAKDLQLSRLDLNNAGLSPQTAARLDKAIQGKFLSSEELNYLMTLDQEKENELLYKTANFLRHRHLGNSCCVHGIIEISNFCRENCHYCGISQHHAALQRLRMQPEEIVETALTAIRDYGFKALVLQSGEDPAYQLDDLAWVVRKIKEQAAVLLFISFGEIGVSGLEKLYAAGARGLLMRFETSNPNLYAQLHPRNSLASRLEHLRAAYHMGYLIITGGLIGLPGQKAQDLVNDILLAKTLHTEMYSFGPFLPHPQTPLGKNLPPTTEEVLKILALVRLADPEKAKILITTAFETLDSQAREKGLMAGANSVMLNVTPENLKKNYTLYPHRAHTDENLKQQIENTLGMLKRLGRAPTDLSVN